MEISTGIVSGVKLVYRVEDTYDMGIVSSIPNDVPALKGPALKNW